MDKLLKTPNGMLTILKKELHTYLNSLIAYITIVVFLSVTGLFLWVLPDFNVFDEGYANIDSLFVLGPYVYLLLIPAISMKTIAEEKKLGTLEILLTKPISTTQLIIGKYLACLIVVVIALLPTLTYYYSVYQLGEPVGNIDSAAVIGSYIGLFLLGAAFTALGILSSSLSSNQIISFITCLFLCFFFYELIEITSTLNIWGNGVSTLVKFGLAYHYKALGKGLIDSTNVVYFVSVILLSLRLAVFVVEKQKG